MCRSNFEFFYWNPPWHGYIKINYDGSCNPYSNSGAVGGIVRDDNGHCSIVKAELWVVLHGIQLARSRGFLKLIAESDSQVTINQSTTDVIGVLNSSISFSCRHMHQEINACADAMAKYRSTIELGLKVFDFPPDFLVCSFVGYCLGYYSSLH
ncbi:putative ribonuclease H protein, partial [Mucuna pruriens]